MRYPRLPAFVHSLPDRLWSPRTRSRVCTPLYIDRYCGPRGGRTPQAHAFWELTAVIAGTERLDGRHPLELRPGMVCLIPPGYVHDEYAPDEVETLWIGFRGRAMPRRQRPLPQWVESRPLAGLMEQLWLFASTTAGVIGPELDAQTANILHRFLRLLTEGAGEAPADPLRRAIEFIASHFAEALRMATVARRFGYSEGHFYRVFKIRMGLPPNAFLARIRIQRAARLLRESSLPVKEIAARVGVPDEAYFSRLFKKMTGASPSAFRGNNSSVKNVKENR